MQHWSIEYKIHGETKVLTIQSDDEPSIDDVHQALITQNHLDRTGMESLQGVVSNGGITNLSCEQAP